MPGNVETHTHLPESAGYVIAILVGILLLIVDWNVGVKYLGWGFAILIGLISFALIIIGFLKLLFG